ncbi:MAG TPA: DUF721 domain-containing protein [Bacteroidales bacterium]|nr:DUF721 domain-containing protein [Bacteroidales bacterium]
MRRSQTLPVGDLLREYLSKYGLEQKFLEAKVMYSWPEVVGTAVAKKTKNLAIKNRVLFVYLESSVVKNHLGMIKNDLPALLNEKAGFSVIDEVVLR